MPKQARSRRKSGEKVASRALRIYDIHTDEWRAATQKDLDDLLAAAMAYGRLRGEIRRKLADIDEELQARLMLNTEEHADG